MLKKNIGLIDRVARIVLGVALIALTLTGHLGVWGWVGVVPLATGLISNCMLYSLLGINTMGKKKED